MLGHGGPNHRRSGVRVARLLLVAIALGGVGAAVTTAAWSDTVQVASPIAASTFDIQARFAADSEWEDVGLPGDPDTFEDGFEVAIPPISDVLPDHSYVGDVFLCNAGDVDGRIIRATLEEETTSREGIPTLDLRLVEESSIEVENIDLGTVIPANSCEPADVPDPVNDVQGIIHFTTIDDFTGQYGSTSQIVIKIWVISVPR
ncbi:SipW-dependent-type signal peptide-containing protein [Agromyces sp. Marseille-Q5079]|uniref:SipW-dependent-type signal peptide-containing protein n=1 Tax=Agromyces sp. Marseille-Q5079 TaxID=3439059 RepID=UPI003D9CBDB1